MNDLSNVPLNDHRCCSCKPIPPPVICILVPLFFVAFAVSILILVVVRNAFFFVSIVLLSATVVAFIVWNVLKWRTGSGILLFLHSFPDSDLSIATNGQLVKITGLASCGSISLESSYERVSGCIYTSTLLYEYKGFGSKLANINKGWVKWSLAYSERLCTDFYITDMKSGIRAMVKAGYGSKVIPLVVGSQIVHTTSKHGVLSPYLRKWLDDRNLSAENCLLHLEEGYIKEGSSVTVMGVFYRNNDVVMIIQPPELISTGCLWQKLLLPADFNGLILGIPKTAHLATHSHCTLRDPE